MRQFCEFRVNEKYAHLLFSDDEGIRIGDDVRKVLVAIDDPRFKRVEKVQKDLRQKNDESFFWGTHFQYRYSKAEFEAAELFHLRIRSAFEPAGEECGTVYDESETCSECGAGRRQVGDLILDLRKAPKVKDIARTIAVDERIVSQRLAELMVDAKLTGFELGAVRHKARYQDDPIDLKILPTGRKILATAMALGLKDPDWEFYVWLNRTDQRKLFDRARMEYAEIRAAKARKNWKPLPVWYQLIVTSKPVPIVPPTKTGILPFDEDSNDNHRCSFGHVIGLNLLSEVSVSRDTYDGSDIVCTSNLIGHRMGLLVPWPCLLISPRFYQLLKNEKIKGYKAEIAHLV
jgi:hypothetical protein